jgi:hypothetical protein
VQRTVIFVAMVRYPRFEGAAHRNIEFNVTVRCTFNHDLPIFYYKYYGALHLKFLQESPVCLKGSKLAKA